MPQFYHALTSVLVFVFPLLRFNFSARLYIRLPPESYLFIINEFSL